MCFCKLRLCIVEMLVFAIFCMSKCDQCGDIWGGYHWRGGRAKRSRKVVEVDRTGKMYRKLYWFSGWCKRRSEEDEK